jgi:hypothetical protein
MYHWILGGVGGCLGIGCTCILFHHEWLHRRVRVCMGELVLSRGVDQLSEVLAAQYASTGDTDFARLERWSTKRRWQARGMYLGYIAILALLMVAFW